MRALGIDLGSRRVGLATCDARGTIASPLTVLERTGDPVVDRCRIVATAVEEEADVVVVGLPLSLDGSDGPAAAAARVEAAKLAAIVGRPVVLHDERLSTVTAHRLLREQGRSERARRKVIDQAAAAVLLQAWLDAGARTDEAVTPDPSP